MTAIPPRVPPTDQDEFFIGWLALPRTYRRLVRIAAVVSLLLAGLSAALLALPQRSPGDGVWNPTSQTLVGLAQAAPYPLLWLPADEAHPSGRAVLLVAEGKFGAARRIAQFAGRWVRVRGTLLVRDGRALFELASEPNAVEDLEQFAVKSPFVSQGAGQVRVRGEIIDPKCYLGAMKPGGGKTHKACAALCIRGGIPPMLLSIDPEGRPQYYLLTGPNDEPLHEQLAPFAGDLIAASGRERLVGDLRVLAIDLESLARQ